MTHDAQFWLSYGAICFVIVGVTGWLIERAIRRDENTPASKPLHLCACGLSRA